MLDLDVVSPSLSSPLSSSFAPDAAIEGRIDTPWCLILISNSRPPYQPPALSHHVPASACWILGSSSPSFPNTPLAKASTGFPPGNDSTRTSCRFAKQKPGQTGKRQDMQKQKRIQTEVHGCQAVNGGSCHWSLEAGLRLGLEAWICLH